MIIIYTYIPIHLTPARDKTAQKYTPTTPTPPPPKTQVNLEVDVLAKYVERSMGPLIDQLKGEVAALQMRVAELEGR